MRTLCLLLAIPFLLSAQVNSLSPAEVSDGWILLFDGETLFGWTAENGVQFTAGNGVLLGDGTADGWLRTNSSFADFDLKLDFRAGAKCNSGVFLRAGAGATPTGTVYEVQIWNEHPDYPTGSLVNLAAARGGNFTPDEWNTMEMRVEGDHWVVSVNGKQVLDTRTGKAKAGHIGLQFHPGSRIEFRNVKLKPLGLKPIFNGKGLTGWHRVGTDSAKQPPVWSVTGGAIHVEKGPGQLETAGTWADFVLQLDIRTNPKDAGHHPNSGIFFRGRPGGFWTGYESQIRNEYTGGDRSRPVDFGTGGIYNYQPARRVVSDDGKFFTKTIVARGRHLAVWVNGYPVTDWEDPHPEGSNVRKKQAVLTAGTISLQAHDPTTNLDFKNIRIAVLPK